MAWSQAIGCAQSKWVTDLHSTWPSCVLVACRHTLFIRIHLPQDQITPSIYVAKTSHVTCNISYHIISNHVISESYHIISHIRIKSYHESYHIESYHINILHTDAFSPLSLIHDLGEHPTEQEVTAFGISKRQPLMCQHSILPRWHQFGALTWHVFLYVFWINLYPSVSQ